MKNLVLSLGLVASLAATGVASAVSLIYNSTGNAPLTAYVFSQNFTLPASATPTQLPNYSIANQQLALTDPYFSTPWTFYNAYVCRNGGTSATVNITTNGYNPRYDRVNGRYVVNVTCHVPATAMIAAHSYTEHYVSGPAPAKSSNLLHAK